MTSGCELSSGELADESSVVLSSDALAFSSSSSSSLPHLPPRAIAIISYILLPSSAGLSGCGNAKAKFYKWIRIKLDIRLLKIFKRRRKTSMENMEYVQRIHWRSRQSRIIDPQLSWHQCYRVHSCMQPEKGRSNTEL